MADIIYDALKIVVAKKKDRSEPTAKFAENIIEQKYTLQQITMVFVEDDYKPKGYSKDMKAALKEGWGKYRKKIRKTIYGILLQIAFKMNKDKELVLRLPVDENVLSALRVLNFMVGDARAYKGLGYTKNAAAYFSGVFSQMLDFAGKELKENKNLKKLAEQKTSFQQIKYAQIPVKKKNRLEKISDKIFGAKKFKNFAEIDEFLESVGSRGETFDTQTTIDLMSELARIENKQNSYLEYHYMALNKDVKYVVLEDFSDDYKEALRKIIPLSHKRAALAAAEFFEKEKKYPAHAFYIRNALLPEWNKYESLLSPSKTILRARLKVLSKLHRPYNPFARRKEESGFVSACGSDKAEKMR
ncbi:MAG: hypothetical protein FWF97_00265 [Alphaproteobacteria bacterium]|nr:hypothetical protein [Alphaproteobacteria bacterium]